MKHWIQAARLRTLPLSISGIIVGSAFAYAQGFFDWKIFVLAFLTTLGLQIVSNYANDYGDGIKGTDAKRIGEKRMVAAGVISASQMKKAVVITSVVTFLCAISLIYVSFGKENFLYTLFFLVLGILAIIAAIKYTVGENAYGYSGFGDIFVFIFFGLVSVLGSHFLYAKTFVPLLILPACAIGFLSVAVLNLNNMRDIENDTLANKNTLIVKFGLKFGLWYQRFLVFTPIILTILFFLFLGDKLAFAFALFAGYLLVHNNYISRVTNPREFDSELKKIALTTFVLSIFIAIKLIIKI